MAKIMITNKTDYDTPWLRKIFNRCFKMVNRRMRNKKRLWTSLRVEIVYKKSLTSWTSGSAYYNRNWVHLEIPRPPEKMIMIGKRRYNWDYIKKEWKEGMTIQEVKEQRKEVLKELPEAIARTFVHELYHCYGYGHEEMKSKRKKIKVENTYNYSWLSKYPVQMKVAKPKKLKPKKDLQLIRYEKVLGKVKEYTSKIKRYQNILRKYKAKKKYYEKILMAAGKIRQE